MGAPTSLEAAALHGAPPSTTDTDNEKATIQGVTTIRGWLRTMSGSKRFPVMRKGNAKETTRPKVSTKLEWGATRDLEAIIGVRSLRTIWN